MRKLLVLLSILIFIQAYAQDSSDKPKSIGNIDKYTGHVLVHKNDSPMGEVVDKDNYPLHLKDILVTKRNSQTFITLVDKSRVILGERSTLIFDGTNSYNLSQSNGKVVFHIYKKDRLHGVKIKTKNAIIGVKGTTFAVDSTDNGFKLYMKEGTVSVDSIKGEFEVYKKSELSEFQKYQQQYMSDYDKYKNDLNKEFREYVKSFSVSGGDSISVVGNKVVHIETPEDIKQMFNMLNNF